MGSLFLSSHLLCVVFYIDLILPIDNITIN